MRLGYVSQYFESGDKGPGCISSGVGDPGGKSYGIYQFSEGVARSYWLASYLPIKQLSDVAWKEIAATYPIEFLLDQHCYGVRKFYSASAMLAKSLDYDTSLVIVQESIFSAAIQHGAVQTLLRRAALGKVDPVLQVQHLYKIRSEYVKSIHLSEQLVTSLLDRYSRELPFVLQTSAVQTREFSGSQ